MSTPIALNPDSRAAALRAMAAEELDVLVVGGGIVGVGAALDAVTRGFKVGLVEQRDLASGTSSRSSKLVHGGLRYLEMFDFALVKEALEERGLLLTRLAPHLVRPVPFLYPLEHAWERPYVGAGVALYDAMAMAGKYDMGVPKHKHLFRKQLARMAPDLRADKLHGAIRYYDCHRVAGVVAHDLENDATVAIRAKVVINAAGVWTDQVQELLGGQAQLDVDASKGIHLVVPRDRIRSETGFITKTEKSVLFVIPWDDFWIIGTTDTPWDLDLAHPAASRADIDYVLGHLNALLRDPLDHDDVVGVYAGLRPLLKPVARRGEQGETTKLSREHTVVNPVPGLVLIAGGKLTTYRVMARDAVDHATRGFATRAPSITERVPLVGAWGFEARTNQRVSLSRSSGVPIGMIDHLLGRYGGLIDEVLDLIAANPLLAAPLVGAPHYLAAEVVYAVTNEGARHLDDVLTRRTRISIETFDRGVEAARPAAVLMAQALAWTAVEVDSEVDHYLRRVAAERRSQLMPTDQAADEARVQAPDIV